MKEGSHTSRWTIQLAVTLGYALLYLAIRPFSDAHFPLTYGLRMTCLLLVPYRYWPALVLGEVGPMAYQNYQCVDDFGPLYVALRSIPPIVMGMPVVWWCRSRLALFPSRHTINVGVLLLCSLLVSTVWACATYATLMVVRTPSGSFEAIPAMIMWFLVGTYVAILSTAPWAVMARISNRRNWFNPLRALLSNRELLRDLGFVVVPALVVLGWLSQTHDAYLKQLALMSMFLPAAWLAFRHGWRIAVLGGTLAIASIALLLDSKLDPVIQQTQAFMAFALSWLYAAGAQITAHRTKRTRMDHLMRDAQQAARKTLYAGEQQLQQTSRALECVLQLLRIDHEQFMAQLRLISTDADIKRLTQQADLLEQRIFHLAESIHPSAWRNQRRGCGFISALRGAIGRTLNEAGMPYRCTIKNELQVSELLPELKTALYRVACGAVACVSSQMTCSRIHLALRSGLTQGQGWAVLRIDGVLSELTVATAALYGQERERIAPKLGAWAPAFDHIRDFARLFDGELRIRTGQGQVRVIVLLREMSQNNENRSSPFAATPLCVS